MAKIVIFGNKDIAEIAHFYLTTESHHEVVGFTVDRDYVTEPEFAGLPVVPFDEVTAHFPPEQYQMFVALSYSKLNRLRREKYLAARALGYSMISFVHPQASVASGVKIGENCFILEHVTVQPFVSIGENVTIWSGTHVGHHVTIRSHCFVTSHVVIAGGVDIGECSFLGVNATLRDHIKIGESCIIGAGALVMEDAEPDGLYVAPVTERAKVPSSRIKSL